MTSTKEPGPPCKHMEGMLNETADGSVAGWQRYYVKFHTALCPNCASYLRRLKETLLKLRQAQQQAVPPDAFSRLESKLKDL